MNKKLKYLSILILMVLSIKIYRTTKQQVIVKKTSKVNSRSIAQYKSKKVEKALRTLKKIKKNTDIFTRYNFKTDTEYHFQDGSIYYLSKNLKANSETKFKKNLGNILEKKNGFIIYKPINSINDEGFPLVINKRTQVLGYITGDITISKDQFSPLVYNDIEIIGEDTDLDIYYLKVKNINQIKELISKYEKTKYFEVFISSSTYKVI